MSILLHNMFAFISCATCEWPEMHSFQLRYVVFCYVLGLLIAHYQEVICQNFRMKIKYSSPEKCFILVNSIDRVCQCTRPVVAGYLPVNVKKGSDWLKRWAA